MDATIPIETAFDLIDSHAHVDVSDFDADRDAMFARARATGVGTILVIGGAPAAPASAEHPETPETLGSSIPYAEKHDWIYAAAGIHPHEAGHASLDNYETLTRLAKHPRFLAWGEIGLDYHYDHSPRDVQQRVFIEQMEMAHAARKPIVIHCREAWPDCLRLLDRHWAGVGLGGIFHCFSGTLEEARQGIAMGFLISFAANVTYPKSQNLRDVAAALPLDAILTETDSPFLSPQGKRGKRNEPANVVEVARTLGPVRNLAPAELASAAAENFRRFFGVGKSRD